MSKIWKRIAQNRKFESILIKIGRIRVCEIEFENHNEYCYACLNWNAHFHGEIQIKSFLDCKILTKFVLHGEIHMKFVLHGET